MDRERAKEKPTPLLADAPVLADAPILSDAPVAETPGAGARLADPGLVHPQLADPQPSGSRLADARVTDASVADARVTDTRVADTRVADAGLADAGRAGAPPEPDALARVLAEIAAGALALDRPAGFPAGAMDALRRLGVLLSPAPKRHGGQGLGTEPAGAAAAADLLRRVGAADLSVGRLLEGHLNALQLIVRYGTECQIAQAAADARAGHLFGIWVTDGEAPLRVTDDDAVGGGGRVLRGGKAVCSGAGWVTRPLVTARTAAGDTIMLLPHLEPGTARVGASIRLAGMRAAATAAMDLDGVPVAGAALGGPGDYLLEPAFSAGAWRGIAVALGGIEALVAGVIAGLRDRGRDGDPHQRARIGQLLIARETARHWVQRAATAAETNTQDPGDIVALVGLARIAVEAQALAAIALAQRALGLAAFREGATVERVMRDLATYLRQPAPDETLADAAAWFTQRAVPA